MNLLCDKAPDTITASGVEYKINTDFRVWIKFELILTVQVDNTISAEILAEIQQLIFKAPCPMNEETVEAILNFYRCGKPPEKLFQSLRGDCMFVKIVDYRTMPITPKMSTADRNFFQKMKKLYALPLPQSVREKYNAIEEALLSGKSVDELI